MHTSDMPPKDSSLQFLSATACWVRESMRPIILRPIILTSSNTNICVFSKCACSLARCSSFEISAKKFGWNQ